MPGWLVVGWKLFSDERVRRMYASGRGDATARRMARFWAGVHSMGLLPTRWVTLEVPGHRTGELRRFPLGMADVRGRWYLVSMLGECAWVRNVRAADGRVVLRRRHPHQRTLQEVPVEDRGPILRRYVDKVPGGRPHIPVARGAPVEEFQAVAADYPVFVVIEDVDDTPA
ncbi:MAG: nitroreductase/quinone reductase family protein [Acidimicrobiia bacterium]|nr:nitroreductase/quinone reductase family protein [Acidimicrobiia bacterium]